MGKLYLFYCVDVAAVRISGTEYVERGETIHLECNASGKSDPPHDLHWLRDDRPIQSDPNRSDPRSDPDLYRISISGVHSPIQRRVA